MSLPRLGCSPPAPDLVRAVAPARRNEARSREQAINAVTRGSADAKLNERDKGHVIVGARADLTVLSADPFTLAPDALTGIHSRLTIVGGGVVHDVC